MCTFPYCQYEKPIRWVVLWEVLALKPILLMLFYIWWHVGVVFVLRILRVPDFLKVRKRQRKEKSWRSWLTENWNITSLEETFSDLCGDFNDDFLYIEGKFIGNVSSVNGWKVWLFVEVTSTSDILISDYFVREKWETFESWFLCETWLTTSTVGLYIEIFFNLPLW